VTSRLPFDLAQLDAWLIEQRWFRSRTRPLRAVEVRDSIPLPAGNAMLLVLLASYLDGAEERYLVPVVGSTGTPREAADGDGVWRTLLALMAEGRTNAAIAKRLWLTERTIETHVRSILGKLGLPISGDDHRRVLAVLTYLRASTV